MFPLDTELTLHGFYSKLSSLKFSVVIGGVS